MERLTIRAFAFAGLLAVAGAVFTFSPRTQYEEKTEDEVIALVPTEVDGMTFAQSPDDERVSYRMSEQTYDVLKPFGIVARVFTRDRESYDAVVIASRSKESFHDPRVCFSAQGWTIEKFESDTIPTEAHGEIPITVLQMNSAEGRRTLGAFLYKGPEGFYASTQQLKMSMLLEKARGGKDIDGVFYRFIPGHQDATREELMEFVSAYIDAAHESSDGYL